MGKRDRLLIGGILVLALVLAGVWLLLRRSGGYVVVRVDGAETARYSLSEEEAHQWTAEAKADSQSEEQITFGGA